MKCKLFLLTLSICSSVFGSLTVSSVSPNTGTINNGGNVTINGSGFTEIKDVYFGSVKSHSFTVLDDSTVIATAPTDSGPMGLVHVTVSNANETSDISFRSRYIFTQGKWLGYLTGLTPCSIIPLDIFTGQSALPSTFLNGYIHCLAINSNNTRVYFSHTDTNVHDFVVVDIANNKIIKALPFLEPIVDIAISPIANLGYVIYGNSLSIINLQTDLMGSEICLPYQASQLVINPFNKKAYISHYDDNAISVVDLATKSIVRTIYVRKPYALGVHPEGHTVYACTDMHMGVAIDTHDDCIASHFEIGSEPYSMAINPNGHEAYVANFADNTISVINLSRHERQATIPAGQGPNSTAVTPDGKMGYVANSIDGTITPIDLACHIPLGAFSQSVSGIAITPDQTPIADFKIASFDGFLTYSFDASSSITPVGEIVSYTWDFGDNSLGPSTPETTNSPYNSHTYGTPGTYTVTLTVTNSAGTSNSKVFTGKMMSRNGNYLAQIAKVVNVPWPCNGNCAGNMQETRNISSVSDALLINPWVKID
jgi:YVTN family beta-propeller protein